MWQLVFERCEINQWHLNLLHMIQRATYSVADFHNKNNLYDPPNLSTFGLLFLNVII